MRSPSVKGDVGNDDDYGTTHSLEIEAHVRLATVHDARPFVVEPRTSRIIILHGHLKRHSVWAVLFQWWRMESDMNWRTNTFMHTLSLPSIIATERERSRICMSEQEIGLPVLNERNFK